MLRTTMARPREVAACSMIALVATMLVPRALLADTPTPGVPPSGQPPGVTPSASAPLPAATAPTPCPPGRTCPPNAASAAGAATIEIVLPEGSAQRTTPSQPAVPSPASNAAPSSSRQEPAKDTAAETAAKRKPKLDWFLHGFRLGYSFMTNMEGSPDSDGDGKREGINYKDEFDLKSPHMFLLGYELTQRMMGHSWLNIIFVENIMLAGLEQSRVLPSGNLVLGFEFDQAFQVGVGANLAPVKDKTVHMVLAAGWTPRVGSFYTPVHAFFMPDVDGQHRTGVTVGVNW